MLCFYLSVSLLPTAIDPVEQESDELSEPAPVEATNSEQDQGEPRCILPHSLSFIYFLSYLIVH
jgi:hypothetical protein